MGIKKWILIGFVAAGTCFAAVGPATVNCPQDNAIMSPTGQTKLDINGHKICEYAHQVTPPYTPPQPYDPKNPQPYKAPRVIRHTVWVSCD
jgi:hypothetical protein